MILSQLRELRELRELLGGFKGMGRPDDWNENWMLTVDVKTLKRFN